MRALASLVLLLSGLSLAGTRVLQNDNFTGSGSVYSGVSFGEYAGAGVLFEGDAGDYPMTIIGVDVLAVGYNNGPTAVGSYLIDIYDETSPNPAPRPDDAGVWPDFPLSSGRLNQEGLQLTTSNTDFNRYTLATPLVVNSGRVFVQVTEQNSTNGAGGSLADDTTIALDTATSLKPGANWYFDGFGIFHPFVQPDGGFYNGLNRNWIIRLVLQVPDQVVTVTAITPNTAPTTATTDVVIDGTQFELGAQAFIGNVALTVNSLTATSLSATVPAGITPGTYTVRVHNPGGSEGTLANGFTVTEVDGGSGNTGGGTGATGGGSGSGGGVGTTGGGSGTTGGGSGTTGGGSGTTGGGSGTTGGGSGATGGGSGATGGGTGIPDALALTAVTPTQTYEKDQTNLFLTGKGFATGAKVLIGGTNIEGVKVESAGVISATIPGGTLSAGKFDVSVINLSGDTATLPQSFTVLAGSQVAAKGCGCSSVDVVPLGIGLLLAAFARRRSRSR